MATPVQIEITANATQVMNELNRLMAQLKQVNGAAATGFGGASRHAETFQQQIRGIIGKFSQLWLMVQGFQGLLGTAKIGVDFNAVIEDARLGMAALITAGSVVKDANGRVLEGQEAIRATMTLADEQIQKLRVAGLTTAATTEQLVNAMQTAMAPGRAAGLTLDQIRQLSVATTQAAQAMQVPMNQLNQEVRTLLEGTVDRNSRVALGIFGSPSEANRQIAQWKQAGTLAENLMAKMASFTAAGKESMNNWTVLLSNVKEAGQLFLGEAFKDPMGELKRNLNSILTTFFDLTTANTSTAFQPILTMVKDLAAGFGSLANDVIMGLVDRAQRLAGWWAENREEMLKLGETITGTVGKAFGWLLDVVSKITGWILKFMGAIAGLGGAAQAAAVGGIAFIAVMYAKMATQLSLAGAAAQAATGSFQLLKVVLSNLLNALQGGTTWASFASSLRQLITPAGLAVAAIGALAAVYLTLANNAEKAANAILDAAKASRETMTQAATLQAQARAQERVAFDPARKPAERAAAEESLVAIRDQMKALSPEFEKFANRYESLSEAISAWALSSQEANKASLESAKRTLAEMEKSVAAAAATKAVVGETYSRGDAVFPTGEQAATLQGPAKAYTAEDIARQRKVVDQLQEQLKASALIVQSDERTTVLGSERARTQKEINAAAAEANEKAQVALILANAQLRAMDRGTLQEREAKAVAAELLRVNTDIARLRKMSVKEMSQDERDALVELWRQRVALENGVSEIHRRFAAERAEVEDKLADVAEQASVNRFDRRIVKMTQEVDALIEKAVKAGVAVPAGFREKVVATRTQEIAEQTNSELRAKAMKDMSLEEKQLGKKKTVDEQIAFMQAWGERMKLTADQVNALTAALDIQNDRRGSWAEGWNNGLSAVKERWADVAGSIAGAMTGWVSSMEAAFSNFFTMMTQQGTTAGQKWDALWRGIAGATVGALIKIGGAKAADMLLDTKLFAWLKIKEASERVATGAKLADDAKKITSNAGVTASNLGVATSGFFAAHSWMTWVGAGIALAMIATMMSTMKSVKAFAVGGLIDRPTMALMGEAGPEVVAPERDFKYWARGMMAIGGNIARAEAPRPSFNAREMATMVAQLINSEDRGGRGVNLSGATFIGDSLATKRMLAGIMREARMAEDGAIG